jgi:hypothetical protein
MRPDQFVAHVRTGLVRWAWAPGVDSHGRSRSRPPMAYEQFMALTQEWVTKGAACPSND